MAKAPRPGVGKREEAAELAKKVLVFRFADQEHRLAVRNVPLIQKMAVQQQTGRTWEQATGRTGGMIGIVEVAILVWVSRRMAGEPNLSWRDHLAEWDDSLEIEQVETEVVDADTGSEDPQS